MVERRVVISGQWTRSHAVEVRVCEVTLTGLHPGQVYQFRVRAHNAVGWSDASPETQPYRVPFDPDSATAPFFVQALRDATVMEHEKVRHCVSIS
jgi:Fibronectin type III domain